MAAVGLAAFCWTARAWGQTVSSAWDALSEVAGFTAAPDKIRPEQRPRGLERDQRATAAYSVQHTRDGFTFRVLGHVAHVRSMHWQGPLPERDLTDASYFVLRYRGRGHRREYNLLPVVAVVGEDAAGKETRTALLDCSQIINDAMWHVVVGKGRFPATAKCLEVQIRTTDSRAWLEISRCSFHTSRPSVPEAFSHQAVQGPAREPFRCVNLSGLYNDTYSAATERILQRYGVIVDGGNAFAGEHIQVDGVPFTVRTTGKNIVVPPVDSAANAGSVQVLGVRLPKRLYHPVARDDRIEVPVQCKASEVCFLLVSEMAPTTNRYALPKIPLRLSSCDRFAVRLVYTEGPSDWAFPYSMADKGHVIQRMTGAYAVPADPTRTLKSIVFCNRFHRADFDLAAVTVNTGAPVVIPQAVRQPDVYRVQEQPAPRTRPPRVEVNHTDVILRNTHYRLEMDFAQGLRVRSLVHGRAPKTPIATGDRSCFEIVIDDRVRSGEDFQAESVAPIPNGVIAKWRNTDGATPLEVTARISIDQSPQVRFNATVRNPGEKRVRATIRFPLLDRLAIGDLADTWIYFPQYRNIRTNAPGTYLAPNDRSFVTQFFDVFNPEAGIGIGFLTHNLDHAVIDYCAGKEAEGVTAFVQYPAEYHSIEPGKEIRLPETCLVFHGGDWHGALDAYRDWVHTWYKPVKSGGLDWWRKSFTVRSHLTDRAYSWTVPIFDAEKNEYRIDRLLEEDRRHLGQQPDVFHLKGWCDRKNLQGGDFHGGDYAVADYTGGADALRSAIRKLQRHGVRVSLYTIPDRIAKSSRIGRELGPKIAQVRGDGRPLQDDRVWYVCIGAKPWRDHYVQALKRTRHELGVDAIYVDVFGYSRRQVCNCPEHGHQVPLNVNEACGRLARRLRDELPEGVALWSEFPLSDVNSQYISGNITYYFLSLHEYLIKSYDPSERAPLFSPPGQSVYRFAFPGVKQFGFPVGFEGSPDPHELGFLFFNGEGLYDVGWLLYDSRTLARVRKWLAIQREYADCFATAAPEPLVPTEAGQVYANRFPTASRTVWTLWNARFTTYRGPVLAVPHRPGATYRDVWNNRKLRPRIIRRKAIITLTLDPQGLGCVLQTHAAPASAGLSR